MTYPSDIYIYIAIFCAIFVENAEKVIIILADDTENSLSDGTDYVLADEEEGEPDATIFCKSDLTLTGDGSLTILANYNHGIVSKDDLKITCHQRTLSNIPPRLSAKMI